MGKLARPARARLTAADIRRRKQLRAKRRDLTARIQKVDAALAKLTPPSASNSPPTPEQLDQWFEQMGAGLPELPPLAADISRADIYDNLD